MAKIGYIYKIVCSDVNVKQTYVGSTRDMRQRRNRHKHACNNENGKGYNLYLYKFIRENGGWGNWSVIQVEKYEYNTKPELHARERHFIETLHAELNKQVPTRTDREYYEDNKEKIAETHKLYNQNNKEAIAENKARYYEENKEYFAEKSKILYSKNRKEILEYHKRYQQENKDKILKYRQENKEKLKQKSAEKITCECGKVITRGCRSKHLKTALHINNSEEEIQTVSI